MEDPTPVTSTAAGWYALLGDLSSGPYTWPQLYSLAQQGHIGAQTQVWHASLPAWVVAAHIPGLIQGGAAPLGAAGGSAPMGAPAWAIGAAGDTPARATGAPAGAFAPAPAPTPEQAGRRRRKKLLIAGLGSAVVVIAVVAVLLVLLLTGGGPDGPGEVAGEKIKGRVAQVGGVVMRADIPDGSAALTVAPVSKDLFEGNAASDVATIEYTEPVERPVTISIPVNENDGGLYKMGVGSEVYGLNGEPTTLYRFYDVEISAGVATATFVPAEVLEAQVRFISSSDVGTRPYWLRTTTALFSVGEKVASGPDGTTHFRFTYPKKYKDGREYLSQDELVALFDLFEDVFDMYQTQYQYQYAARTKYPIDIYAQPLGESGDGFYSQWGSVDNGYITLNTRLFYTAGKKEFDPDAGRLGRLPGTFAHEFFHLVQANYTDQRSASTWFDEATATYFESLMNSGTLDAIDTMGNWKRIYDGIFPPSDTAEHGYARMPLIEFLAGKTGDPDFIRGAYSDHSSGWEQTIVNETQLDPADYAVEFYSDLLQQRLTTYRSPAGLFWDTVNSDADPEGLQEELNRDTTGVCSLWRVEIPEFAKAEARLEQQGEVLLGTAGVKVPAYGARLFAVQLFTNMTILEAYPDEVEIHVVTDTPGCELRLLEIRGQESVFLDDGVIVDPKSKIGHGYDYLALAVCPQGQAQDLEADAYLVTGDPQEYVWGLVDIKPHGTTTFDQTELLGQEFSISATPGSCSIRFVEKNLGKQTVRSVVYTMPAYLEPNKPFQPALPVSHSDFEFYCMLDGTLGFSLNADGTAFTYNNKNGLPPPGESTTASETHTIMVGMFHSNMKVGAQYVYKWMPKKDVSGAAP